MPASLKRRDLALSVSLEGPSFAERHERLAEVGKEIKLTKRQPKRENLGRRYLKNPEVSGWKSPVRHQTARRLEAGEGTTFAGQRSKLRLASGSNFQKRVGASGNSQTHTTSFH